MQSKQRTMRNRTFSHLDKHSLAFLRRINPIWCASLNCSGLRNVNAQHKNWLWLDALLIESKSMTRHSPHHWMWEWAASVAHFLACRACLFVYSIAYTCTINNWFCQSFWHINVNKMIESVHFNLTRTVYLLTHLPSEFSAYKGGVLSEWNITRFSVQYRLVLYVCLCPSADWWHPIRHNVRSGKHKSKI